jgi:hypothetical protein
MWRELHWGNWLTVDRENEGTPAKLGVGHLEISRLAQPSFEENPLVLWEETKILETEKNPVYRSMRRRPT